ncbi:MAG: RES family NAD+ phosphorylase [Aquisalimonadaceae bacterium]
MSISELLKHHVGFDGDLNRNVAGMTAGQDPFDDLETSPEDRAYALVLESRTRESSSDPIIEKPFLYGVAPAWPFLPECWHGTRYSDGTRFGVWYGSPELHTTVHETAYHWLHFITDSFPGPTGEIIGDRHIFLVHGQSELVDLRGREQDFPALVHPQSYAQTQPLGKLAHERGEQGLLTPSARHAGGINAAIFRQSALSRARNHCHLTYRWKPEIDSVTVERSPGRTWLRLRASELLGSL